MKHELTQLEISEACHQYIVYKFYPNLIGKRTSAEVAMRIVSNGGNVEEQDVTVLVSNVREVGDVPK